MARANPKIGKPQPTLFGKDEPVFVPLKSLSDDEIVDLPRDAFSDDEFAELEEEQQAAIHENDPDSALRIKRIVDFFLNAVEWLRDNLESDAVEHYDYVSCDAAEGWTKWNDLIEEYVELGYTAPSVEEALHNALGMSDNMDVEVVDSRWNACADAIYVYPGDSETLYVDSDSFGFRHLEDAHEHAFDDETLAAIEAINYAHSIDLTLEDIEKLRSEEWYTFEARIDTGKSVCFTPDLELIREALDDALDDAPIRSTDERTPEERVMPLDLEGGFYVQELVPAELEDESRALGICVGDPDFGYGRKIARGITKILSMRTPSGKSKLTFEVDTERDGTPKRVVQIKGKANRLPSKPQEVRNAMAIVEHLGLEPDQVADLKPALGTGTYLRNPRRWHCGFCRKP